MTRIIPRHLITHLEWTSEKEVALRQQLSPVRTPYTIEELLAGKVIDCVAKIAEKGNYIGLATALEEAEQTIGSEGVIASLPFFLAAKSVADKGSHDVWKRWYSVQSEENVGISPYTGGRVVIVVHGGGILTSQRIFQAYKEGLTPQRAAKYTEKEFSDLWYGNLPNGEKIPMYVMQDLEQGNISDPFGHYGVIVDFDQVKATTSGYHTKEDFMKNPLVLARAGTLEYLEAYFDKAKYSKGKVGNWHRFAEIDPSTPQGRVLFVNSSYYGLNGYYYLDFNGCYLGVQRSEAACTRSSGSFVVAPEAHK